MNEQVYLLAGGNGARSGGPKAWRSYEGKSLLERHISFLLGRFAPENIAVSIQAPWKDRCLKIHPKVRWVAEDPQLPPMSAIQALFDAMPLKTWAFLYHVDMPVWEPALFEALAGRIAISDQKGIEALAPIFQGRKGHPILLSPRLGSEIAALDATKDRMDLWLRSRREDTVDVPFACIHENWNQPH